MLGFLRRFTTLAAPAPPADDPFSHPAVAAMSLRDLADLPMPRPAGAPCDTAPERPPG